MPERDSEYVGTGAPTSEGNRSVSVGACSGLVVSGPVCAGDFQRPRVQWACEDVNAQAYRCQEDMGM